VGGGGVLTPEATHKSFVTPASRESRDRERNCLPPQERGREGGREKRREPQLAPGEAMIKAVMLGRGSLLGGPRAPKYSSTSPFPSSGNFHLVAIFESIHYETLKARDTQSAGVERARSHPLREAGRMCIRVAKERMRTPIALSPGKAGAPLRPWSRKATAREDQTRAGRERHRPGQALGETTGTSPAQETGGPGLGAPFLDFGTEVLAPAPAENP